MTKATTPPPSRRESVDKLKTYTFYDLGQMPFADMRKLWRDAREDLFRTLSLEGKTYEEIGAMFGMTRQMVGYIIGEKPIKE